MSDFGNFEQLGARERQIVEAIYRLEEGSVGDVLAQLPDPPSYSAVRAMLNILVEKGYLDYRPVKNKYLYRPAQAKKSVRKSMLRSVLDNFFGGQTTEAVAALLDGSELNEAEYERLRQLIDSRRQTANRRQTADGRISEFTFSNCRLPSAVFSYFLFPISYFLFPISHELQSRHIATHHRGDGFAYGCRYFGFIDTEIVRRVSAWTLGGDDGRATDDTGRPAQLAAACAVRHE